MGHRTRWGLPLLATLLALGCGEPAAEEYYVMNEYYQRGSEHDPSGGCTLAVYEDEGPSVGHLRGGPPGMQGEFSIDDFSKGNGLEVTVSSQEKVLVRKFYDADFIRSGQIDRFRVTSQSGLLYELAYWGGPSCLRGDEPVIDADAVNSTPVEQED